MFFYTFMPKLFNMSLTASVAIVLVILLRLLLKKAPKVISYALWGVVLFRLLCPVSIGSSFSLYRLLDAPIEETGMMTSVIGYVPSNIVHTEYPSIVLPVPGISNMINETLPQGEEQLRADPLEGPIFITTCVWMAGVLVMAIYSIISYIQLRRKLAVVVPLRDNIFIADDIRSPFVVGLFWPRIYLPCNLGDKEQEYIILHEQHHIKRLDHIVKALAFLALAVHWFNPLVWVAFILAGKDMEMSCDEAVIRKVGSDVRADYSASLLTLATGRRIIAGTPLAFGEGDTKGRIRNLAKWKKPAFWVVLISVIACVTLAVGLLTNPIKVFEGYYRIEGYGISNGREYHIVVNDNIELKCTKEQYEQVVNLVERFRTGELDDMPIHVTYKQFLISYKRGTVIELELIDPLTCNVVSDGINTFVKLVCFPEKVDRNTDNWPVAQINESGTLQFALEANANMLVVSEDYYRKSENATNIERNTFEIARNDDGFFTIDIARRGSLEDHVNYFLKIKDKPVVYVMKVVFAPDDSKPNIAALELKENTVVEIGRGTLKTAVDLTDEDAAGLLSLVESGTWVESSNIPDYDNDCAVNLGGRLLYYCSGRGIFTELDLSKVSTTSYQSTVGTRWWKMPMADRLFVNNILCEYVDLPYAITDVFGLATNETDPSVQGARPIPGNYDFDHDGVPETTELVTHFDGVSRYTWFELQVKRADGTILWSDEAHTAHSGYNSMFACRLDGKDYLLQYRPTMYQGNCDYSYRLFSLDAQGNILTNREASVSFDINWGGWLHGEFNAIKIAAFMDEVNSLLTNSKLLVNTDTALTDIDPEKPQDIPWWLRDQTFCAGYVYDKSKTLRDNLLELERVANK